MIPPSSPGGRGGGWEKRAGVMRASSHRLLVHPGQQIEHRHAHRDAVRDLLEDHRVGTVGQLARNLHSTVHRAGMHDDDVVFGGLEALGSEAEKLEVLAYRG